MSLPLGSENYLATVLILSTILAFSIADPTLFFGLDNEIVYTAGGVVHHFSNISFIGKISLLFYCPYSSQLFYFISRGDKNYLFSSTLSSSLQLIDQKQLLSVKSREVVGLAFSFDKNQVYWATKSAIYYCDMSKNCGDAESHSILTRLATGFVDSMTFDYCKGVLFWIHTATDRSIIKKAEVGNQQVLFVRETSKAKSLSYDHKYSKLFWISNSRGTKLRILSCDYYGNQLTTVLEIEHQSPHVLLSHESLFWTDLEMNGIWTYNFSNHESTKPILVHSFEKQPIGLSLIVPLECNFVNLRNQWNEETSTLVKYSMTSAPIFSNNSSCDVACLNGICEKNPTSLKLVCNCIPGYYGKNCELSSCHNYCIRGECSLSDAYPICKCQNGYSGPRCEAYICLNYCLNNGTCSLSSGDATCNCSGDFYGDRCQLKSSPEFITFIVIILLLCLLLLVTWCYLMFKQKPLFCKSVTERIKGPVLTSPSPVYNCNFDIEECCNMNVCTTPCFEVAMKKNLQNKKVNSSKKPSGCSLLLGGDSE